MTNGEMSYPSNRNHSQKPAKQVSFLVVFNLVIFHFNLNRLRPLMVQNQSQGPMIEQCVGISSSNSSKKHLNLQFFL